MTHRRYEIIAIDLMTLEDSIATSWKCDCDFDSESWCGLGVGLGWVGRVMVRVRVRVRIRVTSRVLRFGLLVIRVLRLGLRLKYFTTSICQQASRLWFGR